MDGEIDIDHILGDDPRAEIRGLLPHEFHQFRSAETPSLLCGAIICRVSGAIALSR